MDVREFLELRNIETGNSHFFYKWLKLQVLFKMHSTFSIKLLDYSDHMFSRRRRNGTENDPCLSYFY